MPKNNENSPPQAAGYLKNKERPKGRGIKPKLRNKLEIGKKRAEQLANAFNVHPAIIMFPEYESKYIQKVA
jgi:hypothetical protein